MLILLTDCHIFFILGGAEFVMQQDYVIVTDFHCLHLLRSVLIIMAFPCLIKKKAWSYSSLEAIKI